MTKIKEDDFEQEKTIIPEDETFTPNHLTPEQEKEELADMMSFESIPTLPAVDPPIVPEPVAKEEVKPVPDPEPKVELEPKVEAKKEEVVVEKTEDEPAKEEEKPDIAAEMANLASLFSKDDKDLKDKMDSITNKEEVPEKEKTVKVEDKTDNVTAFIDSVTKGVEYKEVEYLKDEDFSANLDKDDVLRFNIAINTAVQNAINITRKQSLRDNMDVMPKVFDTRIQTHLVAFDFWKSNPHLKKLTEDHPEWSNIISKKADAIQANEPNLTQRQVLVKTGKEIEAFLKKTGSTGYSNTATEDSGPAGNVPALPKKPGQVVNRSKPTKITAPTDADEIAELVEFNRDFGV